MKETKAVLSKVCQAIEDKKGEGIVILDISDISSFTDYFVICNGLNRLQNQAICDEIRLRLKRDQNLVPSHIEGYDEAEWILMDYLQFVVHIFSEETREFYKLERLWSDGEEIEPAALIA